MFRGSPVGDCGIAYFRATNPFDLAEVADVMMDVANGLCAGIRLDTPALVDLRGIDLTEVPEVEMRRYIMLRSSLGRGGESGPVSVLCDSVDGQVVLRLYGVLSDLMGLRSEQDYLSTNSPAEAFDFICTRAGLSDERRAFAWAEIRRLFEDMS